MNSALNSISLEFRSEIQVNGTRKELTVTEIKKPKPYCLELFSLTNSFQPEVLSRMSSVLPNGKDAKNLLVAM